MDEASEERESVYAVVWGDYEPIEVHSLHRSREGAGRELATLDADCDWRVRTIRVEP